MIGRPVFIRTLLFGCLVRLHALAPTTTGGRKTFDGANDAWDRGDYIAALNGDTRLLNAPDGDAFLEPIALRTGELFKTHELMMDGRAGRLGLGRASH